MEEWGRGEKGAGSVDEASGLRKPEDFIAANGDPIHKSCRSSFTDKKSIRLCFSSFSQGKQTQRRKSSRLTGNFNFKSDFTLFQTYLKVQSLP